MAGMAVVPWTPKFFGLFLQLRDLFPCFPGFLGRAKVEMALVKKGCGTLQGKVGNPLCPADGSRSGASS